MDEGKIIINFFFSTALIKHQNKSPNALVPFAFNLTPTVIDCQFNCLGISLVSKLSV